MFQDSDCEGIIDEMLTTENEDKESSYKPFNLNIMEISDVESSEEEDPEERHRRIEQLAAAMNLMNHESSYKRGELNMDIDTLSGTSCQQNFGRFSAMFMTGLVSKDPLSFDTSLSERSEEESDREQRQQPRQRRQSGRKRSMSRERNVAKIRWGMEDMSWSSLC